MKIEQLRGYLLEEALAHLLKSTGYDLLLQADVDGDELVWLGNGLNVRGRGTDHQADVLGQLSWTPAFSRPLRMFVEAKFRASPIGAEEIREAVGILADVNSRHSGWGQRPFVRRYSYRYAIFSSSGFTMPASQYAIAHEISLVDLRDGAFAGMLSAVRENTSVINAAVPDGRTGAKPMIILRAVLRAMFSFHGRAAHLIDSEEFLHEIARNLPSAAQPGASRTVVSMLVEACRNFVASVGPQQPILIGMPQVPFFLAMRPSRIRDFSDYVARMGDHDVHMDARVSGEQVLMKLWPIESKVYELRFSLPSELARYVLESADERARLLSVKREALSHITTTAIDGSQVRPVRLRYRPRPRSDSMAPTPGRWS